MSDIQRERENMQFDFSRSLARYDSERVRGRKSKPRAHALLFGSAGSFCRFWGGARNVGFLFCALATCVYVYGCVLGAREQILSARSGGAMCVHVSLRIVTTLFWGGECVIFPR